MEMDRELLDQYRYINVEYDHGWYTYDHGWYTPIYDQYIGRLSDIGLEVGDFEFSGFYSQGDGASFTGTVVNWTALFTAMGDSPHTHKVIVYYLQEAANGVLERMSSRYSHENTVQFSLKFSLYDELSTPLVPWRCENRQTIKEIFDVQSDARADAIIAIITSYDLNKLERDIQDYFRGIMKELYYDLYKEYDNLTSDEVVWDTIVANELHIKETS